jgi:hypothetical protein
MVVVHVDDASVGRDRLRDLVRVAGRRDAGPDVEKLPDPRLLGQVAHRPAEEPPVLREFAVVRPPGLPLACRPRMTRELLGLLPWAPHPREQDPRMHARAGTGCEH